MAASKKFKVVVQKPSGGSSFDLADGAYKIEREALDVIGAEIVEVPAKTEEEFIEDILSANEALVRLNSDARALESIIAHNIRQIAE